MGFSMSTRAIYTFRDNQDEYHVYKHMDGYPSGAVGAIENALAFAWPLPRFEADEFAAGFVASNKSGTGGVRLLHSGKWQDIAPGDIQYRYEIFEMDGKLYVSAFEVDCDWDNNNTWTCKPLYTGTINQFKVWARRKDKAA